MPLSPSEVFVTSVDGALTKRITSTAEQERFLTWTADGKHLVYASERNGKWSIYKSSRSREAQEPFFFASTLIVEEPIISNTVDNYLPSFSPDGKKLATFPIEDLLKSEYPTGNEVELLNDEDLFHMRDGDKYFTWSPDSKWLLVDWSKSLSNSEILLMFFCRWFWKCMNLTQWILRL